MNTNIDKAEKWLERMKVLSASTTKQESTEYINEHITVLKWLIKKAKVVESLDKEKEHYREALHRVAYEETNGWSSMDVLEKTVDIADKALKVYK